MNAIEIKHLSKHYKGFSLENLNLTLPSGCIMGIVGENGAGKSTTIKLILDILRADRGSITILGRDNRENTRLTKDELGVVLDEVGVPECLNATQIGKVMSGIFSRWNQPYYDSLLTKLSLPCKKPFKDFSRGMKMKLGLAIALSHEPKLLILDEATSGLDPVVRDEVVEMLLDFTRDENHSILISSHIVSDLEKLCDYIAFLHRGKLLLCEEKDVLLSRYGVIRCPLEVLDTMPAHSVLRAKRFSYGAEALVLRDSAPEGYPVGPVNIEELFLFMVKEGN